MPVLPGDDAYTWTAGDGTVLDLTDRTKWLVLPGDGFGLPDLTQATRELPYAPGAVWVYTRPAPRTLTLRILLRAATYTTQIALRQTLVAAFSPSKGLGTLTIARADGSTRVIQGVPDKGSLLFNASGRKGLSRLEEVKLFCPSPFWSDGAIQQVAALVGTAASGSFPQTLPFALSTTGSQTLGTAVTVTNAGDWEAPVTITIPGPCQNPQVVCATTSQAWQWQNTLPAGYTLRVTSSYSKPLVQIVDPFGNVTNGFGWLTTWSVLWMLPPGASTIVVRAAQAPNAQATIAWTNVYSGI